MNRTLDVLGSFAATVASGAAGLAAGPLGPRPAELLRLYEFEACPFCRKVRAALTTLDLEALILPCPKGGRRFRPEVRERGGREQFPFLVDPNTGKSMYESDEIVAALFAQYGAGPPPPVLRIRPVANATAMLASALRPGRGLRARPSRAPEKPLELYSFEASPYCRIVREVLCELELPYHLYNVGKGSPSRDAFVKRSGRMQVPWLVDPNTRTSLFESADIVRYLEQTYGVEEGRPAPPDRPGADGGR